MYYFIVSLFTIFLVIIFSILIIAMVFPLKINFTLNSEETPNFCLTFSWLNFFLKGTVVRDNDSFILTVKVLGVRLFLKRLKGRKGNYIDKINLLKAIKPKYIELNASYGFEDPSVTGMVCGAFDLMTQYINLHLLSHYPNFNTELSYFNISGSTELNLIQSFIRFLKYKKTNFNINPAYTSR